MHMTVDAVRTGHARVSGRAVMHDATADCNSLMLADSI